MNNLIIQENGPGTRKIKPGICYYCENKIGETHKDDCIVIRKLVKIRFIIDLIIDEPLTHSNEEIEFRYNEGSWCADNFIDILRAAIKNEKSCLCSSNLSAKVIETVDETPFQTDKSIIKYGKSS